MSRKPVTEFLTVEDLGEYCLPSVQRDFVWDEDDVLELIDSLLKGYPIGVITVLETDVPFPSVPLVDVPNSSGQDGKAFKYVLDGQQRLTSLLLIRDGWKIMRNGKPISREPIQFNPDDGTLRRKGKKEFGFDFSKLTRWTLHKEPFEQSLPRIQTTLEQVNKDFLTRPLGFFIIRLGKGADEDKVYGDMAEIFTRINRAGIRLGNLEMFLSFFASASLGKQQVVDLYEQLKEKHDIDLEPIIRLTFSNLELTQSQISRIESFKRSAKRIRDNYSEADVLNSITNTGNALETTMAILRKELGISSADMLPSQTCLVILSKYLLEKGFDSADQVPGSDVHKMIRWLMLSSFYGLYSSHTDTRLEGDLKIVEKKGLFPIGELLASMDQKNLRTQIEEKDFKNIDFNVLRGTAGKRFLFVLYVLLHRNRATDWTGKPLSDNVRNLARHHILPKDNKTVREVLDDDVMRNHLGNLTFIDAGRNEEIGDELPEEYLSRMSSEALREHFIPTDSSSWKPEKYEEFIKTRMGTMWNSLDQFMTDLSKTV